MCDDVHGAVGAHAEADRAMPARSAKSWRGSGTAPRDPAVSVERPDRAAVVVAEEVAVLERAPAATCGGTKPPVTDAPLPARVGILGGDAGRWPASSPCNRRGRRAAPCTAWCLRRRASRGECRLPPTVISSWASSPTSPIHNRSVSRIDPEAPRVAKAPGIDALVGRQHLEIAAVAHLQPVTAARSLSGLSVGDRAVEVDPQDLAVGLVEARAVLVPRGRRVGARVADADVELALVDDHATAVVVGGTFQPAGDQRVGIDRHGPVGGGARLHTRCLSASVGPVEA